MFVSVICELAGKDKTDEITELMLQYGFEKIMTGVFETITLSERNLSRLKRDLDRNLDIYDKVRIYQYPMEKTLVISYLEAHRWKRLVLHDSNYVPDLLTAPEEETERSSERKLQILKASEDYKNPLIEETGPLVDMKMPDTKEITEKPEMKLRSK